MLTQEDGGEGGRGQSAGGQSPGGGAPRPAPVCPGGPSRRGGKPHSCQVTGDLVLMCDLGHEDCVTVMTRLMCDNCDNMTVYHDVCVTI